MGSLCSIARSGVFVYRFCGAALQFVIQRTKGPGHGAAVLVHVSAFGLSRWLEANPA